MNKEYSFLYRYLEKLKIFIDKNEFEIQIQSHPDCPSLLAITDVLSFFNIENGVLQVGASQIKLLPDCFVAILDEKNKDPRFYYIEKKGEKYLYVGDGKYNVSRTELESQWSGIVLLIEKSKTDEILNSKRNKWSSIVSWFKVRSNQFTHNYQIFKSIITASSPILDNMDESATILIGNTEAKLKIILVTNPFSGHCREAHLIMTEILQKYFDLVCFDIRFNFNSDEYSNKKSKKIHQYLVALYYYKGQKGFMDGIDSWFRDKDENKLYSMQGTFSEEKINKILSSQFNFNMDNELMFTPQFIINNYRFPKQYDQRRIVHFIKDFSKDEYLNN